MAFVFHVKILDNLYITVPTNNFLKRHFGHALCVNFILFDIKRNGISHLVDLFKNFVSHPFDMLLFKVHIKFK